MSTNRIIHPFFATAQFVASVPDSAGGRRKIEIEGGLSEEKTASR